MTNPKTIFCNVVRGSNIITPQVIAYEYAGSYVVELSKGTFMNDTTVYGVTVVHATQKRHEIELSKSFPSRKGARAYINLLAQQ